MKKIVDAPVRRILLMNTSEILTNQYMATTAATAHGDVATSSLVADIYK